MANRVVTLEGRGALTLRDSDYVTSGGEASIYRANSTIVKIYTDNAKMSRDGMSDKVQLLAQQLHHADIVAPQGLVLDPVGLPVGFYMPFVDGEPMARVFVSDFRARTGFRDKHAVILVEKMREVVAYAHAQGAVMVDANELNWLVDITKIKDPAPKVIDVDSWAIGRWPATVIMPSIRDWKAKSFDENTDWFAWGIVAFQVFTGIHPYKGKLDGYRPGDMVKRMQDNASVFSAGARLPHSVRDFSCIPGPLLDWFQATFQAGDRSAPPSALATAAPAKAARTLRAVATASGQLIFEKIYSRPGGNSVVRTWPSGAALLASGQVVDMATGQLMDDLRSSNAEVIKTPHGWLLAGGDMPLRHWSDGAVTKLDLVLAYQRLFRAGNRLFAVTDREMVELQLKILGKPVVTLGARTSVRPNSTNWFDGVAVQDVLGSAFLILPIDGVGIVQPRVKELDGTTVVAARAGGRFASFIVLDRSGDYRKIELTFDRTFTSYTAWSAGTDSPDLNSGILPSGVVGTIVEDGELVLFVPTNGNTTKIQDRGITTNLRLSTWGDRLIYINDGAVWRVRTKS